MTPKALIAPARLAGTPMLRTQTDERLVDLVRAGNDAAFEAIVARYRRPLLRYCARLLGDGRADDAVQAAFLRAYDGLHASNREMHLRPWLFRIAHNTALNALRDGGLGHEELSDEIDGVERPDQALERREGLREVVAAVEMLPARQRDAIVLRELEGRSYDEIAASLGVTEGAVRQLLSRARTTLRAGVTAVTPFGLLARGLGAPGWGGDAAGRVAELCGGAAGGAVIAKACATVVVTGAIVGGVATAPEGGEESSARPAGVEETRGSRRAAAGAPEPAVPARAADMRSGSGGQTSSGGEGRGSGDDGSRSGGEDRSGPGSGDGSGSSGSGSSGSGTSGSGSEGSGSGSSGSGSGSGSSGSGSGDSGSSGSGSSGTGTGSSGSDSGSSGTSGSGSSGSGGGSETSDRWIGLDRLGLLGLRGLGLRLEPGLGSRRALSGARRVA